MITIDKNPKGLKGTSKKQPTEMEGRILRYPNHGGEEGGAGYRMQEKHICYSLYYLCVIYIIHIHKRKGKQDHSGGYEAWPHCPISQRVSVSFAVLALAENTLLLGRHRCFT